MASGVFEIRNEKSNWVYIAYGKDMKKVAVWIIDRLWQGRHSNKVLQEAFNRDHGSNFRFSVLVYCEPFEMKRYREYFRSKPAVYNHLPEPKEKKPSPRQHLSASHRANISFAMLGVKRKPFSAASLEKMSKSQRERFERDGNHLLRWHEEEVDKSNSKDTILPLFNFC